MSDRVAATVEDLVAANRILAHEGIIDAFGHISARHPENPQRYLLSRARAPLCIEAGDIMEFELDGLPVDSRGRMPFLERFIHGAAYELRPHVHSVIHNHSQAVIPFSVTSEPLRPLTSEGAVIGHCVPTWDTRTVFGETNMLVSNLEMGRDLARTMGENRCCLMRGHGCVVCGGSIRAAVFTAIALTVNAKLQSATAQFDDAIFLSPGEIDKVNEMMDGLDDKPLAGRERAWEFWCKRAGVAYRPLLRPAR